MDQLTKLKQLLGIKDNNKDIVLRFVINTVEDMVLTYCHIPEIPVGLEHVILTMCVDKYRLEQLGQEQATGIAQSISEGDVSVTFAAVSSTEHPAEAFLKDYMAQLNQYRKAGW